MKIYFDENFSPNLVNGLRELQKGSPCEDVVVSSVAEVFGRGAPDEVWIPKIAGEGGIVITQDLNIHRVRAQWQLCQKHRLGVVFLKPSKKKGWGYWKIVETVLKAWPHVKEAAKVERIPCAFQFDATSHKWRNIAAD